jgi:hypothetical protein
MPRDTSALSDTSTVRKSFAMKQADACPLKEHHNDYPSWGYDNEPSEEFAAAHIQCRCKGCGLYLIWVKR